MDRLGPGETTLLRLLSWLAPDPLPMWVLESEETAALWQSSLELRDQEAAAGGPADTTQPTAVSPSPSGMERGGRRPGRGAPRAAALRLADYGMLRYDTQSETVSVHRVVQEIVRARLPEDQRHAWLGLALNLIDAALPAGNPDDVRTWPFWVPLCPHVAAGVAHGEAAGIPEPTSRRLNQLGQLLYAKVLHAEAEPLFRRALAIDERSFGPDHPKVARHLNNLAQLLQATNRLADAAPLMRRMVAIFLDFTRRTGHEHPHLRAAFGNYAELLRDMGRSDAEIQAEINELKAAAGVQ